MKKIRTAIAGGGGYTGGELIRLLTCHPEVELVYVHSNSRAGKKITEFHPDLIGETSLEFTDQLNFNIDLLILCLGHGKGKEFLNEKKIPENLKIIDLSQDFRLNGAHGFIYGLPELNKKLINKAQKVANPGCFASAIQLALLPSLQNKIVESDIHISAVTGSTGAGVSPTPKTHFSWRNNNISVYKAFVHQHLNEINETALKLHPEFNHQINFIPYRGNFSRGILASIYFDTSSSLQKIKSYYKELYESDPFVHIISNNPDLKQVVNTNKCLLYLEKHKDKLLIICTLDNLLKGASGQAVQNMNIMFDKGESMGLKLKAVVF